MLSYMLATLTVISLIANICLVFVTSWYTLLTQRLVRANNKLIDFTEKQMEAQQRPYIEIAAIVREGANLFQLRIANTGQTSARRLKLTLTPEFYRYHEKSEKNLLQGMYPFNRPIPSFAPKSELVFDLGATYRFFQEDETNAFTPTTFVVRAQYEGGLLIYDEETTIDLHMYYGVSAAAVGSLQELKELNKNVEALANAVKSLRQV